MLKNLDLKNKILPHVLAILGFMLISYGFLQPAMEGKILKQGDIIQYKGAARTIEDYNEKTGETALWTNALFSGMPSFQIRMISNNNIYKYIHHTLGLGIPRPMGLLFIGFIGFYLLMVVLGISPSIGALGSIAYGLSTYTIVILEAGHNTKILAMAYLPMVIGGVILAFRGKYFTALILTAIALGLNIKANHFQVTYYAFLIGLIIAIYEFVFSIKNKELNKFAKACGVLALASMLALGPNVTKLWTTYDYAKETIRGGSSELSTQKNNDRNGGLDKDYAQSWSYGLSETLTLAFPKFAGGASGGGLPKKSKTFEELRGLGVSSSQAKGFVGSINTYWGAQPFTSGPVYFGAVIVILFIMSCFLVQGPTRWILISITMLSIFWAWGKNFALFNDLFFNYFPMYNKFRTPSMSLIIAQFTVPLLAVLGLKQLFDSKAKDDIYPKLIEGGVGLGIFVGLSYLIAIGADFYNLSPGGGDIQLKDYLVKAFQSKGNDVFNAIVEDRYSLFISNILSFLFYSVVIFVLLFIYLKNKINKNLVVGVLIVLCLVDLWGEGKDYLSKDNFVSKRKFESQYFKPDQIDNAISSDKTKSFRVLNLASNTFNETLTSYHHQSVGGYHAAKLIRYQDLIEAHISRRTPAVLNMLNARYIIFKSQNSNQRQYQKNPGALGNVWFVDNINWVPNADEEIKALGDFNPGKSVVVDERYKDIVRPIVEGRDSIAQIKLLENKPNSLKYEYSSSKDQLAVFSEVYYKGNKDWKAYIDGEYVPHFRANYVLRAMNLPSGKKKILEFRFEPVSFYTGEKIALTSSVVVVLLMLALIGFKLKGKSVLEEA